MTWNARMFGRLIVILSAMLFFGMESFCVAQPRQAPAANVDDLLAVQVDPFGNTIHGKLSRGEMEDMLYGSLGGSRQAFRRMRRDTIQRYIDRIDNVCKLSEDQKNKIDQSIEIDIARTEAKVASLLSEIQDATPAAKKSAVYNEAWKSIHTMLLLVQRKLGMHLAQRKSLNDFLFRPENDSVLTLTDIKNAIGKLSDGERKSLMSEVQWSKLDAMSERLPPIPGDDPFG